MTEMTEAELEAIVEQRLGTARASVRRELAILADRLRPDERVLAMAVAVRGALTGGACLIAATDRRLLLIRSSSCEEIDYDALVSVTDDLAARELSLVTHDRVRTLTIAAAPGATELVAAITQRIGADRVHARAGGAESRRILGAIGGVAVSVCVVIGWGLFHLGLDRVIGGESATPQRAARGSCLDIEGRVAPCDTPDAIFVIVGPRDMRRCPASSPVLVDALMSVPDADRDLSRWCIDTTGRAP